MTVSTISGTSAVSPSDRFEYERPTITKLSPDSGSIAGGETVTIEGTGFGPGTRSTTFTFGSTPAPDVECDSTTQCVVSSPPHHVGVVRVRAYVNGVVSTARLRDSQFAYVRG